MSTGWYYSSRQRPCPLCHNTHGCRIFEPDKVWCLRTFDGSTAGPGWRFIRSLSGSMGGSFVREGAAPIKRSAIRSITSYDKKRNPLPESVRDAAIRKLHRALGLSEYDRHYLLERGIDQGQIDSKLYFSMEANQDVPVGIPENFPGRSANRHTFTNYAGGIACVAFNEKGEAIGLQIRNREVNANDRYRWLSNRTHSAHLPSGELPLTFVEPRLTKNPFIGLVEGIGIKPQVASHRLGQLIIGASGGQFLSSPKLLRRYLDAAIERGCDQRIIQIYPDAGDVLNQHVLRRLSALVAHLTESGYQVQIAWWNQIIKELSPDIDELFNPDCITYINAQDFALLRNWKRAARNLP